MLKKRWGRRAEGTNFSIKSNMEIVQSLLDAMQGVFCRMADEENYLTIHMKSKRKITHDEEREDSKFNKTQGDNLFTLKKARIE